MERKFCVNDKITCGVIFYTGCRITRSPDAKLCAMIRVGNGKTPRSLGATERTHGYSEIFSDRRP